MSTAGGFIRQNCDQPMFHDAALAGRVAVDAGARLALNLNEAGIPDPVGLRPGGAARLRAGCPLSPTFFESPR